MDDKFPAKSASSDSLDDQMMNPVESAAENVEEHASNELRLEEVLTPMDEPESTDHELEDKMTDNVNSMQESEVLQHVEGCGVTEERISEEEDKIPKEETPVSNKAEADKLVAKLEEQVRSLSERLQSSEEEKEDLLTLLIKRKKMMELEEDLQRKNNKIDELNQQMKSLLHQVDMLQSTLQERDVSIQQCRERGKQLEIERDSVYQHYKEREMQLERERDAFYQQYREREVQLEMERGGLIQQHRAREMELEFERMVLIQQHRERDMQPQIQNAEAFQNAQQSDSSGSVGYSNTEFVYLPENPAVQGNQPVVDPVPEPPAADLVPEPPVVEAEQWPNVLEELELAFGMHGPDAEVIREDDMWTFLVWITTVAALIVGYIFYYINK